MAHVLHLVEEHPDFQTRRSVDALLAITGSTSQVVRRLPAAVGRLRRTGIAGADVVHAWGLRALAAAVLGARQRVVFSPTHFPTPRAIHWMRAVMAYRDVQVVCPTATQRRVFVDGGKRGAVGRSGHGGMISTPLEWNQFTLSASARGAGPAPTWDSGSRAPARSRGASPRESTRRS